MLDTQREESGIACRYYQRLEDGAVECLLCPHHCRITPGKTGRCRSRRNHEGVLVSEVYGKPCSLAVDPLSELSEP